MGTLQHGRRERQLHDVYDRERAACQRVEGILLDFTSKVLRSSQPGSNGEFAGQLVSGPFPTLI